MGGDTPRAQVRVRLQPRAGREELAGMRDGALLDTAALHAALGVT